MMEERAAANADWKLGSEVIALVAAAIGSEEEEVVLGLGFVGVFFWI